jgi:hypothetical protein
MATTIVKAHRRNGRIVKSHKRFVRQKVAPTGVLRDPKTGQLGGRYRLKK